MKALPIVLAAALALSGCAKSKVINGKEYEPYGLLTADDKKDPAIKYEVVWGNVFWCFVFRESIIVPGYFVLFSLFEPVGPNVIAPSVSAGAHNA